MAENRRVLETETDARAADSIYSRLSKRLARRCPPERRVTAVLCEFLYRQRRDHRSRLRIAEDCSAVDALRRAYPDRAIVAGRAQRLVSGGGGFTAYSAGAAS